MEMTYEILVGILAFVGMLVGLVKPIITLNTNITELRASMDSLREMISEVKERLTVHGAEIDEIQKQLVDHEARIKALEK